MISAGLARPTTVPRVAGTSPLTRPDGGPKVCATVREGPADERTPRPRARRGRQPRGALRLAAAGDAGRPAPARGAPPGNRRAPPGGVLPPGDDGDLPEPRRPARRREG